MTGFLGRNENDRSPHDFYSEVSGRFLYMIESAYNNIESAYNNKVDSMFFIPCSS